LPEQVSKQSPRVVCISRAFGAGGEVVGRTVAEELGFAYVDEEIVQRAAALVDVPTDLVANAEERKSLAGRILRELAGGMAGASIFVGGMQPPEALSASDDYRELIQQAIHETAERGNVVIVAHAASFALAGKSAVLRVLITGSPAPRTQRLTEEGLSESEAAKLVERGDRARADYLKRFYGVKEELPAHYDLVVSTDTLPLDAAAKLVVAAGEALASAGSGLRS
jgi:cytidylate kinase